LFRKKFRQYKVVGKKQKDLQLNLYSFYILFTSSQQLGSLADQLYLLLRTNHKFYNNLWK